MPTQTRRYNLPTKISSIIPVAATFKQISNYRTPVSRFYEHLIGSIPRTQYRPTSHQNASNQSNLIANQRKPGRSTLVYRKHLCSGRVHAVTIRHSGGNASLGSPTAASGTRSARIRDTFICMSLNGCRCAIACSLSKYLHSCCLGCHCTAQRSDSCSVGDL